MNLYESMNKGFLKAYGINEDLDSINLNEDFSDQLPDWAQNAIKGGRWNSELKKRLIKQNIDLANAEVEVVDPSTLTLKGVKTGIDEQGNVLMLKMAVDNGRGYVDNFVYIPGIYNDDYPFTNPRLNKWQSVKLSPAKDIISWVDKAILIKPSSTISQTRADRKKARANSIDRGKGQYSNEYNGEVKWYQSSREDKSGYSIPDITKLYSKLTNLTPDNYEERLNYIDKKLAEVKSAVTSLLNNPNIISNLFSPKFGTWNNGVLRELSDIEEEVIKASKEIKDLKNSIDRMIAKGKTSAEDFEWLNDEFWSLRKIRAHLKDVNDDIKKILSQVAPVEEVEVKETEIVEESLSEDYDNSYLIGAEDGTDQLIKSIQHIVRKYGDMELTGDIELAIVEDEHGRRLHIQ